MNVNPEILQVQNSNSCWTINTKLAEVKEKEEYKKSKELHIGDL